MAQTGYTPILIYSSSTTTNVPTAGNLTNSTLGSELAINITDGKLFYKDNGGVVQVIAWKTTPTTAGGTGLTSYTAGDLLYYASGTALTRLAIGANKTVLTSTGTAPQWSTNLDTTQGGTGLTSYTAGDLTYYAAGTALTKLAIGANTFLLTSNGSAPVWASPSSVAIGTATNLAGGAAGSIPYQSAASTTTFVSIGSAYQALQVNAGGTAPTWQASATSVLTAQGDLLYASAANTLARLAKNTTATRYLSNTGTSNNPAWSQVDLSNGVTGTLPTGNGGTGLTSFTSGGILYASGIGTLATGSGLTTNGVNIGMVGTSPLITVQDNASANNSRLLLEARSAAVYVSQTYSSSTIPMIFSRAGTSTGVEWGRWVATGGFQCADSISVGGVAPTTSGFGVTFPASQSASSNANTLDDYEEGTWTPIDTSGAGLTLAAAGGVYTKIGRVVYYQAVIRYPTTASGLDSLIGGFPFASASATENRSGSMVNANSETTLVQALLIETTPNLRFYKVGFVRNTNAELSGDDIYFSGFYYV